MKSRLTILLAVSLLLLLPSGCGKKLPTAVESGQGYQRTALVEVFTAENCTNCPKADSSAERIAAEMGDSICLIELHPKALPAFTDSLGIEETDSMAARYWTGMPDYGGLPLFACDGGDKKVGANTLDETYQNYRQRINARKLRKSPVRITLNAQADLNAVHYTATMTADASLPPALNLRLVLVVVEDSVSAYGKQNRHVARSVYPNTNGDSVNFAASGTTTRSGSIPTVPGWLPYRLTLVAYVRDNTTREVLQSAKVRIVAATTAPAVPALIAPVDSATGIGLYPSLSWNASGGAASYTLQVAIDSMFTGTVASLPGLTNTGQTLVNGLANATTYYWRVSASNNAGASAWSAVRSFTTTATALLPKPAQIWPDSGAAGISTSPALVWSASSGAASYSVQVATTNSFSTIVYARTGLTDSVQAISGLANVTTYYWRVNAVNIAGPSQWSRTRSFTTTTVLPPATPALTAPANGDTAAGTGPRLSWNASSGAGTYALQVSTASSFSSLVYDHNGLSGTSAVVSGLPSLTTYYWRVNASNASGTSGWSDVWSFTDAQGFPFSRLTTLDQVLQAPDTLLTYSLANPPADVGFHIYIKNLGPSNFTISGQSPTRLSSDTVLLYGELCTEGMCLPPDGVGSENLPVRSVHHWTLHFALNTIPPPQGLQYITLSLWDAAHPGNKMNRKLYLNVIP